MAFDYNPYDFPPELPGFTLNSWPDITDGEAAAQGSGQRHQGAGREDVRRS